MVDVFFNITNIIHITTNTYRVIMYNMIAFFIFTLFAQLYVRIGIIDARGKHLHDRIISQREVWPLKTF